MNKNQNRTASTLLTIVAAAIAATITATAHAHDLGNAGLPVCLESNFMLADAQNEPFAPAGPGRVIEMNTTTGDIGITFLRPEAGEPGTDSAFPTAPDCPDCDTDQLNAWKPTGVLSGGVNGHAFISSAAWHTFSEFHRDGTHVRSVRLPTAPAFSEGPGAVPRLLGSQTMPNGNLIQTVCDAGFFNAPNTLPVPEGTFPPVWSTPEQARNSRLLVLDQETLEVIDEYSAPDDPRWTCAAGIVFSEEGMYVSMFHGAAVFVIDWKAGLDKGRSTGIGSNCNASNDSGKNCQFRLGHRKNVAEVIRVIDLLGPDAAMDDPRRRDSLRAITLDSDGNLYATFRDRAVQPNASSPADFRNHVAVVPWGEDYPTGTIAMDHGVQVIAGTRVNRISAPACAVVNPDGSDPDACNVETIQIAASAFNPGGCDGVAGGCYVAGGGVGEYLLGEDNLDGPDCREFNIGCAKPVHTYFNGISPSGHAQDAIDPRMLMTIHEAFVQ